MPEYLGDGVYASFDGYQIWLSTRVDGRGHSIAVERDVMENLSEYARRVHEGEIDPEEPPR